MFVLAAVALAVAAAASAKDFKPGDLRLCNATTCVPIRDRHVLDALSGFYYSGPQPPRRAPAPALGTRAFELRFTNGYATGIVATRSLDRFLSFGVNLGRFHRGFWYRVPAPAAAGLRRLAAGLRPLRVTPEALAKSR